MTDPRLGPDPDEVVARVLAELRNKGLLSRRQEPAGPDRSAGHQRAEAAGSQPAGAKPASPTLGPRVCPQRSRCKRWGAGSRAHRPTRLGQPVARSQRVRWAKG
jgi:hypothetical protein